ncbi:MAG: Ca2+/H+ antiporter, family [Thermoplasmata archaeon]|nr:Ca2+/H+ antiporter, family [Thermoplasmata archaeon]
MAASDLLLAFAVVFVAELGDKTQLAVALLASRGRATGVVLGAWAAFAILTVLACTLGAALAAYVPARLLRTAAGLLFLAMAALALRNKGDGGEAATPKASFVGAFAAILLAEMGDKTQLATATLAASGNAWLVGIGAFVALALSALLAALLGAKVLARLPPKALRWTAATAFAVAGVALLVEAWLPRA